PAFNYHIPGIIHSKATSRCFKIT
ncbi:uncharacterized protein METZ01_LOCUS491158, partial [marine metagenome]